MDQHPEIIAAPFTVWIAPVGTDFPAINEAPAAPWTMLGTNGVRNYAGGGVTVSHQRQIAQPPPPAGQTVANVAMIESEILRVRLELLDLTLEQYAIVMGGNAVATIAAGPGTAGYKVLGLALPVRALPPIAVLVRGPSPYADGMTAQYEVPSCYEAGSPTVTFTRKGVAALSIELVALPDPAATSEVTRFGRLVAQNTGPGSPAFTVLPFVTFTGVLAEGAVLTINPGTVSGGTVTGLQLLRDGVPIPSAVGTSYTVVAADVGKVLTPTAVATGPGGKTPATGTSVGPVADLDISLTTNTINFTFASPQPVGQYWNGEPYVVAPSGFALASTTPPSLTSSPTTVGGTIVPNLVQHGLMLNPALGTTGQLTPQGFTNVFTGMIPGAANTLQPYSAALNRDPGFIGTSLSVPTSTSIVKMRTAASGAIPNNLRDGLTTDMAIVTVVPTAPPANAFRPHPSDPDKTSYFTVNDIDVSFLPNLAAPSGMPAYATLLARVAKSYQEFFNHRSFNRNINPINHQKVYGGERAAEVTEILFAICTDAYTTEQKRELVKALGQIGLDILTAVKNGGLYAPNPGRGGTNNYVKATAALTRKALENASATSLLATYASLLPPASWAPEDQMFRTVNRVQIETPTVLSPTQIRVPFEDYMENAPLWALDTGNVGQNFSNFNAGYRSIVGGPILRAVFVLRLLGLQSYYTTALRDYVDWWYDYFKSEPFTGIYAPTAWMQTLLDAQLPTVSSNYSDAAAPSIVRTVARGAYVWFEFDKLLSRRWMPTGSDFAVTVNGSPATVSVVADNFTTNPATSFHRSPNIYGRSMAVRLATPLTGGETVTIAYTQPGSNQPRTLGGAFVPTIAATAATNLTGVLPNPVTTIQRVNGQTNLARSLRQISATRAFPSTTVNWVQASYRFRTKSRTTNDTYFGSSAATGFFMQWAAATTLRIGFVTNSNNDRFNFNNAHLQLPDNTWVTMHLWVDYNATTIADMHRVTFRWDGGSWTPTPAGAARASVVSPTLAQMFSGGLHLGGGTTADREFDGDHEAILFRWGTGAAPAAPNFSDPQFAWNADWGGNGQNVWGQPQLYFAGSVADWNSAVTNYGSFGAYPLLPIRGQGDGEEEAIGDFKYVLAT